jgi:hypothetical protein
MPIYGSLIWGVLFTPQMLEKNKNIKDLIILSQSFFSSKETLIEANENWRGNCLI